MLSQKSMGAIAPIAPLYWQPCLVFLIFFSDVIRKDDNITALIAILHGDCHTSKEIQILMNHSDLWLKVNNLDFTKTPVIKSHPKGKVEKTLYDIRIENGKLASAKVSSNPIEVKSVQITQGMTLSIYSFEYRNYWNRSRPCIILDSKIP